MTIKTHLSRKATVLTANVAASGGTISPAHPGVWLFVRTIDAYGVSSVYGTLTMSPHEADTLADLLHASASRAREYAVAEAAAMAAAGNSR